MRRVSDTHSSAKKYIWAWGIITPFDGPVVPDVKKIDARSRGETSANSPGGGASRASHGSAAKPAPTSAAMPSSASGPATQNRSMVEQAGFDSTKRSA